MENFTNVTLEEAFQTLQTATGQSERTLTNVGAMMLTYMYTCCAGTLILTLGSKTAAGEKVPLVEDGVKDDALEQGPFQEAKASVGFAPLPDTVGVANHDFVLHVASEQPKKGKKKKLVPKKKPKLAKPPLKQLPDAISTQRTSDTLFSASSAGDTPELHAATPEGTDSAEPSPSSQSTRSLRKVPWWVTHRKWWVIAAFSCTYLLCLAAALGSMATGQLSKESGLAWEFYTALFACGCLWMLVQAVLAAVWLPSGKRYATTAFVEATIGGILPFLSDAFDTMKDTLFGALCLMADNPLVNALGVVALLWLVAFHVILLTDTHCQLEFAANHLAVLAMPTLDVATSSKARSAKPDDADEGNKDCCISCKQWCIDIASWAWSEALPLIYKQFTPTKRKMLVSENLPQAVIAIVYLILVGDSPVVAVLNLAIPLLQVTLAWVLFKPVQRRIVWKLARRIDAALEASDLQQLQRLREEAQLKQDDELLRCICLQSTWLVDFVKNDQEIKSRGSLRRQTVEAVLKVSQSLRVCSHCLDSIDSEVLDVSAELKGNEKAFKGVLAIVGLDLETMSSLKMNNNDIPALWAKELAVGLSKNHFLVHLDLSGNAFAADGMKALAQGLKDKSLQSLLLTGNDLGAEGAKVAMDIKTRILKVANNKFRSEGAQAVAAGLRQNETLEQLDLAGNDIGAEGMQALADALQNNVVLRIISLDSNNLGLEGAKAIASAFQTTCSIEDASLDKNDFADEGAEVLGRMLVHNSSLRRLSLASNRIQDAGAKAIGEGLRRNHVLKELNLNSNEIGDPGGEALAQALQTNKTLKVLHIQLNKLGDLGCKALDRQSGTLEELDMKEKDSSLPDITCKGHEVCRLDNATVASASSDNTKIWQWPSGRCIHSVAGHSGSVRGACRPDAATPPGASADSRIKLWRPRSLQGH